MRSGARHWVAATGVALVAAAVIVAPKAAGAEAAAADLVTVDPGIRYQTIDGWGTSLAWWAEATGGWSSTDQRNALADAIFSPTKGLGLNVVRYDIGARGLGDVCALWQRTGAAVPSFEPAPGIWNWSQDPNQRWMLQAAKDRGADRFEAIAYSAPSWMTTDNCSSGSLLGTDNLAPANYGRYADYLATIVKHFHDEWGITFGTVDPFNEPVETAWRWGGNQQGMNLSRTSQNALIGVVKQSLSSAGASGYTAISAPDEQSVAGAVTDVQSYSFASRATLAQLNAHDYKAGQDESGLYRLGLQTGKPVWMSEWGNNGVADDPGDSAAGATSLNSAIKLSQQILLNEQQLHPAAWSIWQAADGGLTPTDGKCTDLWGLVCTDIGPNSAEVITKPKRYYAMGNYSEFVRPGYRMIEDSDPNTFTAYDEESGSLVLVTTNPDRADRSVTYDLSGVTGMDSGVATPHLTDVSHDLTAGSPVTVSGGRLSATLPPRSVTTYVVKGAGGGPGGGSLGKLAAVQFGQQMQVFGRGTDGHGYSDVWTPGGGWSGWQDLGGQLVSDVSAVQFGQQMQVFGRGTDGHGYSDVWTPGGGWSGWQDLGGQLVGDVDAVQFGQQMELFGRGTDGHGYSDVWTPGGGWSGWQDLGGQLV
ncbi:glycoside hydrolase, partial [Actinoplanes sp. NPDC051411]|uniref:glycoside hydrolase n=1 Tax=Actinoplanes sp. NPDC051411 TaxID=3155522 RepID=UPI003428D1F0